MKLVKFGDDALPSGHHFTVKLILSGLHLTFKLSLLQRPSTHLQTKWMWEKPVKCGSSSEIGHAPSTDGCNQTSAYLHRKMYQSQLNSLFIKYLHLAMRSMLFDFQDQNEVIYMYIIISLSPFLCRLFKYVGITPSSWMASTISYIICYVCRRAG